MEAPRHIASPSILERIDLSRRFNLSLTKTSQGPTSHARFQRDGSISSPLPPFGGPHGDIDQEFRAETALPARYFPVGGYECYAPGRHVDARQER